MMLAALSMLISSHDNAVSRSIACHDSCKLMKLFRNIQHFLLSVHLLFSTNS